MSLGINTTTPEGIVLAADSRQSYRNQKGMSRIGSDSASKVFKINDRAGLIVAGLVFLPENGVLKNISRFVEEFKKSIETEKITILETAQKLKDFFEEKYQYKDQLKILPNQIKADLERQGCQIVEIKEENGHVKFKFKDPKGIQKEGIAGVEQLQFIVAGYNQDESHQVAMVYIPGNVELKRDSTKRGQEYGASWIGQIDVVSRIVLGFDGRIGNLPALQKIASDMGAQEVQKQLRSLEYVIQWGTMTLQDGIDFSTLAIGTTTAIQRFSDGIAGDPGDMPGVGGSIDVAVITPEKGFVWIAKKNLKVGDKEVDLEK
ncbi:MAG: hypothetical protein A3F95_01755 [Candidatus Nealsonbacteria bacterium RIFCSPLOWO2_12_FULL_39_31]|uniref:Uncharacterized protein n=1 Tax=Candidatus Nealsonbacteria bacterium RIFCSPLOWO2_12_FULL_39_31 TaxID=1801676 RepID=A0A1G2EKS3_9BACT|nr:MAG: hypothetical protein A3F95_01755 [Candidatus Nealsonbacteria bacterium RIFCSPLOWO2_12_FULL_39_31]